MPKKYAVIGSTANQIKKRYAVIGSTSYKIKKEYAVVGNTAQLVYVSEFSPLNDLTNWKCMTNGYFYHADPMSTAGGVLTLKPKSSWTNYGGVCNAYYNVKINAADYSKMTITFKPTSQYGAKMFSFGLISGIPTNTDFKHGVVLVGGNALGLDPTQEDYSGVWSGIKEYTDTETTSRTESINLNNLTGLYYPFVTMGIDQYYEQDPWSVTVTVSQVLFE